MSGGELVLERALPARVAHASRRGAQLLADIVARAAHERGEFAQQVIIRFDLQHGGCARDRLDAAHAGGDAAFAHDLEEADIAGARDVRAAAELGREVPETEHPHVAVVFLAEERHRARCDGIVIRHHARIRRGVGADFSVHELFDVAQFRRRHGLEVREIEAQPVGRRRALLLTWCRGAGAAPRSRCVAVWFRRMACRRSVDLRGGVSPT